MIFNSFSLYFPPMAFLSTLLSSALPLFTCPGICEGVVLVFAYILVVVSLVVPLCPPSPSLSLSLVPSCTMSHLLLLFKLYMSSFSLSLCGVCTAFLLSLPVFIRLVSFSSMTYSVYLFFVFWGRPVTFWTDLALYFPLLK